MIKKLVIGLFSVLLIVGIGSFYVRSQIYFSQGSQQANKLFEIKKGEGTMQIGKNLADQGLISNHLYFLIYFALNQKSKAIFPGEYLLNGKMTIPEMAVVITNPKKVYERVLFKEGWTAKQMAAELDVHGFSGTEFLASVSHPSSEIVSAFEILGDKPQASSLEGYLFPDTYYFSQEATSDGILKKILTNTENKIDATLIEEIKKQNRTIFEVLTLAGIVEKEMASGTEAPMIAGVFQNRLEGQMLLQSDATLTYVLGDKEDQHSLKDLELDSPYNTYKYQGLPPGPISNPGLEAILAAINPQKSDYHFFLTVTESGSKKTIFSKTFEEHVANRMKYGL
jgi:UPF0755 protein